MRAGAKAGTAAVTALGKEPRSKRRRGSAFVLAATLLALGAAALAPTALAAEAPAKLWRTCETGSGAGQCEYPTGIASDPETGHLYVADAGNNRINELTAWGEFVKAWGWGVVASGPDDKPKNEIQTVTVDATAGSFKLRFNTFGAAPPSIPFDASAATVQAALAELGGNFEIEQRKLRPGDVAVSGPAGGPWTVEFVGDRADTDMFQLEADASSLSGGAATATVATTQQGANFERCIPESGDVCRAGQRGAQTGEFDVPSGVAVDSNGGVYVVDRRNNRVQKFDREGHFVWMVGGDVNKTKVDEGGKTEAERNLCTAISGNVCQEGSAGAGNGQFGSLASITVGTDDTVYVGDQNRIQKLSAEGAYEGEIALPGETVRALAADPQTGQLYLNFGGEKNVRKIGTGGEAVCTTEDFFGVRSIAADPAGRLYVVSALEGGKGNRVEAFNPDCTPDSEVAAFGQDELSNETNIATGSACLTSGADIYLSNYGPSPIFVAAYGPPPDKVGLCPPPPNPPAIEAEFAASVQTTEAILKATINPRFWADTSYYLEYGAQPCSQGPCQQKPLPPGTGLGAGAVGVGVTRSVFLTGLSPATSYHYRFVATSHCVASEPEVQCTTVGADRSFLTFRSSGPPVACPNDASRIGPAAFLPDCRAYEMVSPLDKAGGDISVSNSNQTIPLVLEQSSASGDKLAYGSSRSFGDAASAPLTSQYIAQRIEGQAWKTHSIDSPRGRPILGTLSEFEVEFNAFSTDLCDAWQATLAEPPLAAEGVAGYQNLYRRSDQLCTEDGEAHYEALAPLVEPPNIPPGPNLPPVLNFFVALSGVSADGEHAVFQANDKLLPQASPGSLQLYEHSRGEGLHLVCILPDRTPVVGAAGGCTLGSEPAYYPGPQIGRVSSNGRRIFWSTPREPQAELYLRQNPDQPESERLHGAASGKGDLIGPAAGTGNALAGSELLKNVHLESGGFIAGQGISDSNGGIPVGTTIVKVEETSPGTFTLTLSAKVSAGKTKLGDALSGAASAAVPGLITESGAFEAGQEISAPGIPPGATVLSCSPSCGPEATSLTLSAKATKTKAGAALSATSPCTEADTKACTIPVSKAGEEASGTSGSSLWGAAADGSKAIFSTYHPEASVSDLYEFDVDAKTTTPIAKGTLGVMGISEDANRVYFASREVLSEEANSNGDKAEVGKANLYLREAGGGTEFLATLAGPDLGHAVGGSVISHSARVSPDGAHAAFESVAPLTGYDNVKADATSCGSAANLCPEIYRYDASTKQLTCASCNPSGARPAGASSIPFWENGMHAARLLADDGSRLYFQSADALAPRDTNGRVDIYQWEAPGAGPPGAKCTEALPTYSPQDEGCLDLISSGQSPLDLRFVESSPSGNDVFFTTASSLLPQDFGVVDIYDARVNGGLPIPQSPPPGCEGEACQSPPEAPNDPTPASSAFEGAGNVVEPTSARCRKGKVRRKGRCVVRRHHNRAQRAKHDRGAAR